MRKTAALDVESAISVYAPARHDVPGLIRLINELAAEGGYLFILPIDPETGAAALTAHLEAIRADGSETVLVAASGGAIVGLVTARPGQHPARRGVVEIGIGVGAASRGRGVGLALMTAIEQWAKRAGCHRLHLPVVTANAAAIALYRKLGFVEEGVQRATAVVGGKPVDELMMAKLI